MVNRIDVTAVANSVVGAEARGTLLTAGGGPVLATPTALLVATAIPAVTATPTITRLGGYTPDANEVAPELSVDSGLSADKLIAARLSA
ncbi:hypothetical protein ACWC9R_16495 [Streptomyces sp. NPDC001219]